MGDHEETEVKKTKKKKRRRGERGGVEQGHTIPGGHSFGFAWPFFSLK